MILKKQWKYIVGVSDISPLMARLMTVNTAEFRGHAPGKIMCQLVNMKKSEAEGTMVYVTFAEPAVQGLVSTDFSIFEDFDECR